MTLDTTVSAVFGGPGIHADLPAAPHEGFLYSCTTHSVVHKYIAGAWTDWLTLSAGYSDEQVRDVIAAALVAGTNMTITPNDAGDTITLASSGGSGGSSGGVDAGVYVPSQWGQFWHADLADTASRATAAIIGDSVALGSLTSDPYTKGFGALLATALQSAYGDGGSGWHGVALAPFDGNPYAYSPGQWVDATGTWTFYKNGGTDDNWHAGAVAGATDGPGFCLLTNCANTSANSPYTAGTLTFNRVRGTSVKILHTTGSNPFTVTVDGGAPQTITPSGGAAGVQASTVSVSGAGPHTIVVTATAGSICFIWGIHASNAAGAAVDNYARNGFASGSAGTATTTTFGFGADWSGGPTAVKPASLLVYAHGINDARLSIPEATYAANLRRWVKRVKEAGDGGVDLLFVLSHVGTRDTSSLYHRHSAIMRQTAQAFGAAFVDLWAMYRNSYSYGTSVGLWGKTTSPYGASGTDNVHPGDAGHQAYYDKIVAAVPKLLGPVP